jgi:hypothetical protein
MILGDKPLIFEVVLSHLLMRLSDEGIIGLAHRDEGLEALENDVLFLAR